MYHSCIYSYFLSNLFPTHTQTAIIISPLSLYFLLIQVHNMKLNLHSRLVLFFIFFFVFSSELDARPLTTDQGQNRELDVVSGKGFESSKELLEMEDCNIGDEECLMRRMTLEAHLDYIYTQHHKP